MKLSMNWLADHVDLTGVDAAELGNRLTMATAEIEEVLPFGHGLGEIRVGKVLEVGPHEGADRLQVATVDVAGEAYSVVCGAPNVAQGLTVPVALPGSRLPDGTKIKKAKIRGVASSGMLCSARELGLGDDHAGLMVLDAEVESGCPLPEALPLEDFVIDIDNKSLTHRPDLWGHYGFAREIAGVLGRELRPLDLAELPGAGGGIPVTVEDPGLCPRYIALGLTGIRVGPSPQWMRSRLTAVGLRPISNIVDFTNYVMLEIGQPMHAFDRAKVAGPEIVVRCGKKGEKIQTLDGVDREANEDTLLIADREQAVAVAGVMGGADSEVDDSTTSLILESANFDPVSVRKAAARLGLRTDAATRFEKSLDPAFALDGVKRFVRLCEQNLDGAKVEGGLTDEWVGPAEPTHISIELGRIRDRLGVDIEKDTVLGYFKSLEFETTVDGDRLDVTVPSFRATKDIGIPEDLIEEVGRLYGYDNIAEEPLRIVCEPPARDPMRELENEVRDRMSGVLGYNEVALYSFVSDSAAAAFDPPGHEYRVLRNPIAKNLSRMRRSLVPGILETIAGNLRNFAEMRTFEIGRIYHPASGGESAREERELAILFGRRAVGKKAKRGEGEDAFREVQGALEALLGRLHLDDVTLERANDADPTPWVHPSRSARILQGDVVLGRITQMHPAIIDSLKLEAEVALVTITLDRVLEAKRGAISYEPIPRFPGVFHDLAVVVEEEVTVESVRQILIGCGGELMREVRLFDVYRGKPIEAGKKSLAFEIVYQAPDRTLRDEEVGEIQSAIAEALSKAEHAIRGA